MPLGSILRFLTSGPGLVLVIGLALFTWHKIDKSSAIREAVVGYVADVELEAAAEAEKVLRQRAARLEEANSALRAQREQDEKELADAQEALLTYVESTPSGCAVSRDLLDRLRWD